MTSFRFQKSVNQNAYFLLIKAIMKKISLVTILPFCITQPVAKQVIFLNFTESAPRPIQSSSRNVHYKHEGLKRLCLLVYRYTFK